eukprot:CAMPEP_0198345590 /NCGR_PEP_ID=MMETSP1450-20131203/74986_1 /TAXON_ID=753684 ORGANISM="Madagascaria erythrocladiodes, Strain CCMP3234" /NCGR_SAMPLE_ID=MMETSP1450 /ASSEMBLY_ACC=CAM_ASM_001115 /LENGTH=71 /DNA_ID=CAMNT_0044050945 /DNA_START=11 /DNA_END=223 /DNA_ORIENTATION=+
MAQQQQQQQSASATTAAATTTAIGPLASHDGTHDHSAHCASLGPPHAVPLTHALLEWHHTHVSCGDVYSTS